MKITPVIDEALVASIDIDREMELAAWNAAQTIVASGMEYVPDDTAGISGGAPFRIPVLLPEEIETGDARSFEYQAVDSRELPLPLYWQPFTGQGHDGAAIVARIDHVERLDPDEAKEMADILGLPEPETFQGWGHAVGVFDTGPFGREAERLVRGGFMRGVSADLDKFEAVAESVVIEDATDEAAYAEADTIKNDKIRVKKARLTAATLLGKPAFQECKILLDEDDPSELEFPIEDGMYEEALDDADAVLASIAASAAPVVPPREWFAKPDLKAPTPITVTDEGRVFGHIAAWNVDHIGLPRATKPPRSHSNYAYFRTGVVRTDDGTDVPVGQLTLAGGHAPMSATAALAVKHYDDTASAVADVTAGEDQFGIWVSGGLRPEATPEQVRALRASAPSGDWRPINGRLELVAVCQVNVPGFPVARAMVAGGQMTALVAAGARPLAELRAHPTEVEDRLRSLEVIEFSRVRDEAAARIRPVAEAKRAILENAALAAKDRIDALRAERESKAANEREMLAKQASEAMSKVYSLRKPK